MRKRLKKQAEDLAQTLELHGGFWGSGHFSIHNVMHRFNIDAGTVRRAIKILQDKGKLYGGRYVKNWVFGGVDRGRKRVWRFK